MYIKTYKPLDEDCHQVEEYVMNTSTGEMKFTGRRYRKITNIIPTNVDAYNAFMLENRIKGRVMIFSPADSKSCPYELILRE